MQQDIRNRINSDFREDEIEKVNLVFESIISAGSNTGIDQLLRSILFLSKGDFGKVKKYYSMYCEDPRNIIMKAEKEAGNPGHWFSIPFEEMENFKRELPEQDTGLIEDDLSF